MNKEIIVIPQKEHGLVVNIEADNTIALISKIDIPYKSISKVTQNRKVITLDQKNKLLLIYQMNGEYIKSIPLPFGRTMNVRDNIVYVGGSVGSGEVLYMVDTSCEEYPIKNLKLPEEMVYGKAIDDIVFYENKMYLIDNVIHPKYTFIYDIKTPAEPKWLETISLSSSANQHIHKGDVNKDWLVYFSSSSTRGIFDFYFISILGKERISLSANRYYKENASMSFMEYDQPDDVLGYLRFEEIFIIKNILYVLTDIGLVFCDLDRLISKNSRYSVNYTISTPKYYIKEPNRLKPFKICILKKPVKRFNYIFDNVITFIQHDIHATQLLKVNDDTLILVNENEYELIDLTSVKHLHISPDKFWEKIPFREFCGFYNHENQEYPKCTKNKEKSEKKNKGYIMGLLEKYRTRLLMTLTKWL